MVKTRVYIKNNDSACVSFVGCNEKLEVPEGMETELIIDFIFIY